MESAESFDRDDLATANLASGGNQRLVTATKRRSRRIPQRKTRAANRTRIWLGVEAAVARVIVFGLAARAHGERRHRGVRAVVGQGFNDAETRATVGAVREGIAVAAVGRVED